MTDIEVVRSHNQSWYYAENPAEFQKSPMDYHEPCGYFVFFHEPCDPPDTALLVNAIITRHPPERNRFQRVSAFYGGARESAPFFVLTYIEYRYIIGITIFDILGGRAEAWRGKSWIP